MAQAPASSTPSSALVGRSRELAALRSLLDSQGPTVAFVHGIGGIGKTTLLRAFDGEARASGANVVSIDGRTVEPTEQGFLRELASAAGIAGDSLPEICRALAESPGRTIIIVDTYELLRLLDTWLRQTFVEQLPGNVRLVLAGREPPVGSWLTIPGGAARFHRLPLDVLDREGAIELLLALGVPARQAEAIYAVTLGHPLAISLAAAAASGPAIRYAPGEAAVQPIIEDLARIYLEQVSDGATRDALFAASVVRRTTMTLLAAMLPGTEPEVLFERIRELPFTELARDGLIIHDSVQHAVASLFEAMDPAGYMRCRRAAAAQLLRELHESGNAETWRYTADLLYLIQQPIIRNAFFPRDAHRLAIEPARAADGPAIASIIDFHEGPEAAAALRHWWDVAPWAFSIARDEDGDVAGFYILLEPNRVSREALMADPLTAAWLAYLEESPLQPHERTILCRRWMSRDDGEGMGPVQAAIWLDLKRTYLEMRPNLRRMYGVAQDMTAYGPVLTALGFRPIDQAHRALDAETQHVAMLDFGPRSTEGWLQDTLRRELGLEDEPAIHLDAANREVLVDGQRVPLTRLEFGVMDMLSGTDGAVSRMDLLAQVWGYDFEGGSNVVDVVVRAIRRKLGAHADAIETVRGVGYRLRRDGSLGG